MKWNDIVDPQKDYIKNDSVTLEVHIKVKETRGVRPSFDFTTPDPNCSDGILVIDDVLLHISKTYLALYSPFFSALFFGKFKERNLDQIPLEDTVVEEFVEMLQVIYPSHVAVHADNVEFLLKLGDKYQVKYVVKKCEKFLIKSEEIPFIKKLALADQYGLDKLLHMCLGTLKSTADIKTRVQMTEKYKDLGDATKLALLDKIFQFN